MALFWNILRLFGIFLGRHIYPVYLRSIHHLIQSRIKKIYIYISISSVRLIGVNCTYQGPDSHIYRKHIAL